MDWQTPEDTVPSSFITEANARALSASRRRPGPGARATPPGDRQFVAHRRRSTLERGGSLPVRARSPTRPGASSTPTRSNAVLVLHALTGDSHVIGAGRPRASDRRLVGAASSAPGKPIDTDRWFVVAPNMLGGCQGTHRPGLARPRRPRVGRRASPTSRSATRSRRRSRSADALGIDRWAAVIGGSMGGMQALEWAVGHPDRVERVAVLAAPPISERRPDRAQLGADRGDPHRSRASPAATTTTPPTATARTAGSRSPGGWRCSTTAPPPSSTTASSAAGRAASARSAAAAGSRSRATSTSTATSSPAASTPTATSRSSRR